MNMFVWTDIQSPPIWKGIVPTRTRKTLVVNPEERTVRHDSLVIPSGFEPITSLKDPRVSGGKEAFTKGFFSPSNQRNYLLGGIAVFLIIVLIVYFLLFRSKTT
jgi:hypothetical protein